MYLQIKYLRLPIKLKKFIVNFLFTKRALIEEQKGTWSYLENYLKQNLKNIEIKKNCFLFAKRNGLDTTMFSEHCSGLS